MFPQPLTFLAFLNFGPLIAHSRTKVLEGVAVCSKHSIKGEERSHPHKICLHGSIPSILPTTWPHYKWNVFWLLGHPGNQTPWGNPFTLHSALRTLRGQADSHWERGAAPWSPRGHQPLVWRGGSSSLSSQVPSDALRLQLEPCSRPVPEVGCKSKVVGSFPWKHI